MAAHNLPHGPFDERPGVDLIGASAVILLVALVSGFTGISLVALLGRALS